MSRPDVPNDMVWLGDLAGWEVAPVQDDAGRLGLELHHRCGWWMPLPECGIRADGSLYMGNLVQRVGEIEPHHVCQEHEPSPEHRARMARWLAASGQTPTGDDAADQLAAVRAASRRPVDGPGCTPAVVADDRGEVVPAGSLYADKCAECTTGASCEDARRCLFEG